MVGKPGWVTAAEKPLVLWPTIALGGKKTEPKLQACGTPPTELLEVCTPSSLLWTSAEDKFRKREVPCMPP